MVIRNSYWVDAKFSPLLKLRNTVGYWKPLMREWCQMFARDRGAALAHAFLFVDGTSRQIANPTPIVVDGVRVAVQRAMYYGNHKFACTSVSLRGGWVGGWVGGGLGGWLGGWLAGWLGGWVGGWVGG